MYTYSTDTLTTYINYLLIDAIRERKGIDELLLTVAVPCVLWQGTVEDDHSHPKPLMKHIKMWVQRNEPKLPLMREEVIRKVLEEEWLSDEDLNMEELLEGFPIIERIAEDGSICLKEKVVEGYDSIREKSFKPLRYNDGSGKAVKGGRQHNRGVELHVDVESLADGYASIFQLFKELTKTDLYTSIESEVYKWRAIDRCTGTTLERVQVLLADNGLNVWNWRGRDDVKVLLEEHGDAFIEVVDMMLNGQGTLSDRYLDFADATKAMGKKLDERTASVLLTGLDNVNYAFYTSDCYTSMCRYLGIDAVAVGEKYEHFLRLVEPLEALIEQDTEFFTFLKSHFGENTTILSLAQNIVWVMFMSKGLKKE